MKEWKSYDRRAYDILFLGGQRACIFVVLHTAFYDVFMNEPAAILQSRTGAIDVFIMHARTVCVNPGHMVATIYSKTGCCCIFVILL